MKKIKRFAAIIMALAMVLALAVPAFAEIPANSTLVVTKDQLAGKTVTAIRMFDASVVDTNGNGKIDDADTVSYSLLTAWNTFFRDVGSSDTSHVYVGDIPGSISERPAKYVAALSTEEARWQFAERAANFVRNNDTLLFASSRDYVYEVTADANNEATFENLPAGYYLVLPAYGSTGINSSTNSKLRETDAILVNVPSDKSTRLDLKSEYPTVNKTVTGIGKETSKEIGDDVPFTLTSAVPEMSDYPNGYKFAFHDQMSKGLELKNTGTTEAPSNDIVVTCDGKIINPDQYDVIITPKTDTLGPKIDIVFDDLRTTTTSDSALLVAGKPLVVTYTAVLTERAVVGDTGNKNTAKVEYSNDPSTAGTGESTPSETKVYTYSIIIHKYHGDDSDPANRLSGATFVLCTDPADEDTIVATAVKFVDSANGAYRVAKPDETPYVTAVTSPTGTYLGEIRIDGLAAGDYYLVETIAPTGYNKLDNPVKITIAPAPGTPLDYAHPIYSKDGDANTPNTSNLFGIENNNGTLLPFTGGTGTVIISVVGGCVIVACAYFLIFNKKKKENADNND